MNFRFNLLAALLVLFTFSVQSLIAKNPDFLKGDAIYQNGKGDATDFPKAIEAFKLAADQGDADAQYFLGCMYQFGHGVPVNLELAANWYLSATEKGNASAWNNLGTLYVAQKKPEEMIVNAYSHSSELGEALGSFNLARVFHDGESGVGKNFTRALAYYQKALAQQPHYPLAWKYIGQLYEVGGFGIERDLKAAEAAWLTGVRENQDKYCYYCLYWLYNSGNLPAHDMPAFAYLEKAAELGNHDAACRAAKNYLNGWNGMKEDPIKAAHFNDLAAKEGRGCCTYDLIKLAKDDNVLKHYGNETTQGWIDRWNALDKSMRKVVADELPSIRVVFESGDETATDAMLDEAFKRWISHTPDKYERSCYSEIWNEAQIRGGRTDLEWGRYLNTWLSAYSENDQSGRNILVARSNLNERLMELGRYGMMRDSCMKSKRFILELEGIDVDAVLKTVSIGSDYTVVDAENLPMYGDAKVAKRSQRMAYKRTISPGDTIGGQAMHTLLDLAQERLSVGDWKSALVLSEWDTRWAEKLTADKMPAKRDYPDCLLVQQRLPYDVKADVFEALGLPEMQAAACQKIIDMGFPNNIYGGRHAHRAQFRLAGIQVDQGLAGKVNLDKLKDVEDHMRANHFDESHAWQFAKLVRARVLAEVKGIDHARPMVSEVLASSDEDQRPLLRLEALLVSADLELKAGNTDGVVSSLEEALSWARKHGLLFNELRIDQLYVTYLIKIGDYDQALAMQRRVLELIDALKLDPRREIAILRLAEIQGMRRDNAAALALLKEIKSPLLSDRIKAVSEGLKLKDTSEPSAKPVTLEQFTLQPMGIQSMPLRQKAEAIFILSNPNSSACAVELTLESEVFGLTLEENSKEEAAVRGSTVQGVGTHRLVVNVQVPSTGQLPLTLSADGFGSLERDLKISIQAVASASPVVQKSEWLIQTKGSKAAVAVIDAAQLRNSAFCLIPVYHHLDALDDKKKSICLRVVASEPTRVEGYNSAGTLLFVDAQGNGSFRDPGDLIATATVDELFPVLNADDANGRIALQYRPMSGNTTGRVELSIETHAAGENKDWKVDAIDWLER